MRPTSKTYTVSQVGYGGWIPLDYLGGNVPASYSVYRTGNGTVTYELEGTLADLSSTPVTAAAFVITSGSNANHGSIDRPMTAVRLHFTAVSGNSEVTLSVLQGGNI